MCVNGIIVGIDRIPRFLQLSNSYGFRRAVGILASFYLYLEGLDSTNSLPFVPVFLSARSYVSEFPLVSPSRVVLVALKAAIHSS